MSDFSKAASSGWGNASDSESDDEVVVTQIEEKQKGPVVDADGWAVAEDLKKKKRREAQLKDVFRRLA